MFSELGVEWLSVEIKLFCNLYTCLHITENYFLLQILTCQESDNYQIRIHVQWKIKYVL